MFPSTYRTRHSIWTSSTRTMRMRWHLLKATIRSSGSQSRSFTESGRSACQWGRSAEIATLLGFQLDTAEQQGRFHAVLLRMQLHFVTTHEYTHHVHGHTTDSTLDSRFANEIDSSAENCDIDTQVLEIDADAYGAYHVLSNLFADERAFAINLLDLDARSPVRQDQTLLAIFVLAVGTFLFVRPTKLLTPENIYTLCHPPQAARMDFIMRTAVNWCRQNRPAVADWMSPRGLRQGNEHLGICNAGG